VSGNPLFITHSQDATGAADTRSSIVIGRCAARTFNRHERGSVRQHHFRRGETNGILPLADNAPRRYVTAVVRVYLHNYPTTKNEEK
jgi:hypothetical protein